MSIKNRLLKIKDHIHTVEIDGEDYYYKHMTAPLLAVAQGYGEQTNAAIIAQCACEEDGSSVFTLDELEDIEQLPIRITGKLVEAIVTGNEKKPQDA